MRTEYNYNNADNFVFHNFNQRKAKKRWFCCAVFAPIINITCNCKITHNIDFIREDIDIIVDRMVKAGKLDLKKWALWLDWVNYVYSYLKEQVAKWRKNKSWKKWKCPNLSTFYHEDEEELIKWINRWYIALIWFWINNEFVKDMIDWKIEKYEDYKKYKWDKLKHFTNMGKWLRSEEKYWNEFIIDSYAYNKYKFKWIYWNFSIKEWLEDLCFRSKYIFH